MLALSLDGYSLDAPPVTISVPATIEATALPSIEVYASVVDLQPATVADASQEWRLLIESFFEEEGYEGGGGV
jgi:hypothetical protein